MLQTGQTPGQVRSTYLTYEEDVEALSVGEPDVEDVAVDGEDEDEALVELLDVVALELSEDDVAELIDWESEIEDVVEVVEDEGPDVMVAESDVELEEGSVREPGITRQLVD